MSVKADNSVKTGNVLVDSRGDHYIIGEGESDEMVLTPAPLCDNTN